jgi:hypothetical protein
MSLVTFSFITLWCSACGIIYTDLRGKKHVELLSLTSLLIFVLLLFSLFNLIIGFYFISIWDIEMTERVSDYLNRNKITDMKNLPTMFYILKIYPYIQIFLGLGFSILYYSFIKKYILTK